MKTQMRESIQDRSVLLPVTNKEGDRKDEG